MSHAAHSPRDPSSLERMSHAAYAPRDISHGAQGPRELKKLSEKGSLLFAAETASTHGHTAGGDGDGGGGGGGEGTGAVPAAPITLSTATEKPHLNVRLYEFKFTTAKLVTEKSQLASMYLPHVRGACPEVYSIL